MLIEVAEGVDPVLDEALNRVRGELSAVGLAADVRLLHGTASEPTLEAGVEGALSIVRDGSTIRIRAYGPLSRTPVVQELDARAAEVTAEVVAVRAVEALRAVTLAFKKAEPKPEVEPKPEPKPEPPPVKPPAPAPARRPALAPRGNHGAVSFFIAPNTFYDFDSRTLGVGGELATYYGRFPCFVGPAFTSTLYRPTLHVDAGSIDTRRLSAALRGGCSLELPEPFELWFSLGGGLAFYSVEGHAATGFVGHNEQHTAPFLTAGVGFTAWISPHVGLFARIDASLATNAPALRVSGSEIAKLERPLGWGAFGLVLQLPGVL
ncbi:MAG: hypothetical protein ACOY0T_07775 [Myxococcota bacterium]